MKTTRQEMESELQKLRPRSPSDRVRSKIASQLAPTPHAESRAVRWRIAWRAMALATAACITVAVFCWPQAEQIPGTSSSLPIAQRQHSADAELLPPTRLAYQHTFAQSPDDLHELLDRHAASLFGSGSASDDLESLYSELMPN